MTGRSRRIRPRLSQGAVVMALALPACSGSTPPPEDQSDPPLADGPGASGAAPQAAPASSKKVEQGMQLLQDRQFEAAKAVLSAAHEEDPKDPQAAYYLGGPEVIADRPAVAAFRAWLLEQAEGV